MTNSGTYWCRWSRDPTTAIPTPPNRHATTPAASGAPEIQLVAASDSLRWSFRYDGSIVTKMLLTNPPQPYIRHRPQTLRDASNLPHGVGPRATAGGRPASIRAR